MTCEEFKNQVIEHLDANSPLSLNAECEAHKAGCPDCARYFDEMTATAMLLRPRHSPLQQHAARPSRRPVFRKRLMQIAAAITVFLCGVGVGLSNLFSTRAQAERTMSLHLEHFTHNLSSVGNYLISFEVRALPDENFSTLDPEADFIPMQMQVMHQNDSLFWRLEKAGGRTVVFDGKAQYLWTGNGIRIKGPRDAGFVEERFQPENLLKQQALLLPHTEQADTRMTYTDSTVVLTTCGQQDGAWEGPGTYRIVTAFVKATGLLCRMEVWLKHQGREIQMLRSTDIRYNLPLNRVDIVRLPESNGTEWQDVALPRITRRNTLKTLQKETATEAARRIMNALIANRPQDADKALYYYRPHLSRLCKQLQGCSVSDFSAPVTRKDYPGVFVSYRLTSPDGQTTTGHLALRRDNDQRIWTLDGGL